MERGHGTGCQIASSMKVNVGIRDVWAYKAVGPRELGQVSDRQLRQVAAVRVHDPRLVARDSGGQPEPGEAAEDEPSVGRPVWPARDSIRRQPAEVGPVGANHVEVVRTVVVVVHVVEEGDQRTIRRPLRLGGAELRWSEFVQIGAVHVDHDQRSRVCRSGRPSSEEEAGPVGGPPGAAIAAHGIGDGGGGQLRDLPRREVHRREDRRITALRAVHYERELLPIGRERKALGTRARVLAVASQLLDNGAGRIGQVGTEGGFEEQPGSVGRPRDGSLVEPLIRKQLVRACSVGIRDP